MSVQTSYTDFPAIAIPGQLADDAFNDLITMFNANSSAAMPFGIAVAFKPSPTYDTDGATPANSTDKIAGILVHSHAHERTFTLPDGSTAGDLSATGLTVGAKLDVLRKGRVFVITQQAVAVGDRLFVCYSAGTVYTAAGQLGNADESSNTIDLTKVGQWLSKASAGGIALLEVDFTNKP